MLLQSFYGPIALISIVARDALLVVANRRVNGLLFFRELAHRVLSSVDRRSFICLLLFRENRLLSVLVGLSLHRC